MQKCVRDLLAFLSRTAYDHALSTKDLLNPTGKEFHHMMRHIFKLIDPQGVPLGVEAKIEEEVPQLFKRLHYPFPISRASLYAVGSPHTWPSLLAAICWLCELIVYQDRVHTEKNPTSTSTSNRGGRDPTASTSLESMDVTGDMNETFFQYVSKSYDLFLHGSDAMCDALDQELARRFHEHDNSIEANVVSIREENDQLQAKIAALQAHPSRKTLAEEKKTAFQSDISKFHELCGALEAAQSREVSRVAERTMEVSRLDEALHAIEVQAEQVRCRLGSQTVSREDMMRMAQVRQRLTSAIEHAASTREKAETSCTEQATLLAEDFSRLETLVGNFNAVGHRVQLMPVTAKRASGMDLELKVDRDFAHGEPLRSDLRGAVRDVLLRLKDTYASKARTLGEELLHLKERHDGLTEEVREVAEENTRAESAVAKLEMEHQRLRGELEVEMKASQGQADRLKEEVDMLRGRGADTLEASNAMLHKMLAERDGIKRRCEREQAVLSGQLSESFSLLVAYKEHVERELDNLHRGMQRVQAEVQETGSNL
jgi:kinetochore protein NDC80